MFTLLLHIHTVLRYIILLLLLITIFTSLKGWLDKKPYTQRDKKFSLFTLITAHLQLVIGLLLYFISSTVRDGLKDIGAAMKDTVFRFWTVEHIAMMLIAITLITSGYMLAKRAKNDLAKHKRITIFFLLALLVIFLAIPWPWSTVARGWWTGI